MLVVAVALFANATSEKVAKPAVSRFFWLDDMTDARMDMVSKSSKNLKLLIQASRLTLQVFQVMALTS